MMPKRKLLLAGLCMLMALPFAAGCSTSPLTGERQFNILPPEQEVALGLEAEPQVVEELGGLYNDPVIQAYVSQVGNRVADQARALDPSLPYEYKFGVVDNEAINAFALPGGPIYVTRGLLFNLQNESQLAGVLAHEAAHVIGQHSATQMSNQVGAAVLIEAAVAALARTRGETTATRAGQVATIANNFRQLSYSRDHEREADMYGLQFLVNAGYQPEGLVDVMRLFQRMEGEGGGPEFLRTHPNPDNRLEYLQETIRREYPQAVNNPNLTVGRERYQQQVLNRQNMVSQYGSN